MQATSAMKKEFYQQTVMKKASLPVINKIWSLQICNLQTELGFWVENIICALNIWMWKERKHQKWGQMASHLWKQLP